MHGEINFVFQRTKLPKTPQIQSIYYYAAIYKYRYPLIRFPPVGSGIPGERDEPPGEFTWTIKLRAEHHLHSHQYAADSNTMPEVKSSDG